MEGDVRQGTASHEYRPAVGGILLGEEGDGLLRITVTVFTDGTVSFLETSLAHLDLTHPLAWCHVLASFGCP